MRLVYGQSTPGKSLLILSLAAIVIGCAAFEAGNILGAAAGISLVFPGISNGVIVASIGVCAGALLWMGTIRQIALVLGIIVAFLGICFLITSFLVPSDLYEIAAGGLIPKIPAQSELLVLGLIGTTVVPYNLFLGSGLKHNQDAAEMKWSLFIAIGLGGLISIAVLITGTAIAGEFTFEALAFELEHLIGKPGTWLLGLGLFGAGLSSTLTAALAAGITAASIAKKGEEDKNWSQSGIKFRGTWALVLLTGVLFGYLEVQPVPAIILAQALNGIFLPLIAIVLFLLINHSSIIPDEFQNRTVYNIMTGIVVYLTFLIGITNLSRVIATVTGSEPFNQFWIVLISMVIFLIACGPAIRRIRRS
jgi:manganese transport protein